MTGSLCPLSPVAPINHRNVNCGFFLLNGTHHHLGCNYNCGSIGPCAFRVFCQTLPGLIPNCAR